MAQREGLGGGGGGGEMPADVRSMGGSRPSKIGGENRRVTRHLGLGAKISFWLQIRRK